jgi:hypothetical protein
MVVTGDTAIEPNASHDVAPEPSVESIDMAQTTTSLIAMLLIGIVIGVAGNSLLGVPGAARVRVVEGYAFANMDGEAIGLSAEKGGRARATSSRGRTGASRGSRGTTTSRRVCSRS